MLVERRNMEPLVFSEPVPGAKAAEAALPQGTSAAPSPRAMKLVINGFGEMERRLLNGIILLSKRRQPMVELLSLAECSHADVVMIDGTDQKAMEWATDQAWLKDKAVIWVDAAAAAHAHISVKRPITWSLPMLLARALEQSAEKIQTRLFRLQCRRRRQIRCSSWMTALRCVLTCVLCSSRAATR